MVTIILVRHGENDWVKKNRLAGWIPDIHLNENGRLQAQAAADRLARLPVKAVYSSPVLRCMETAVTIATPHILNVVELPAVGEVHYGQWEGQKIKKLARQPAWQAVQHYPSRFQFPEGESLRGVQFRAVEALETLSARHEKEVIIVVSHADLIKLILAYYLGVHVDLFQRLVVSPASASVLALQPNGVVRVVRVNDDGPLELPTSPHSKQVEEAQKEG